MRILKSGKKNRRIDMIKTLINGALALGILAAPVSAKAAACGTMGFGDPAGTITVDAFLEAVEAEHAAAHPEGEVELITFGLG